MNEANMKNYSNALFAEGAMKGRKQIEKKNHLFRVF